VDERVDLMARGEMQGRVVETKLNLDLFFGRPYRSVLISRCHERRYSILTWSLNSMAMINTRLCETENT
jgi:hypothetical protein